MSTIEIGISGWTYEGWRGSFYPEKLKQKEELEFASHAFPTIEINGTFYGLQRPSSFQNWYDRTPPGFVFSVKANRYITHIKRLHDVEIPMANFFASGPLLLKEKLGPFLWQFPPSMSFDPEKFEAFLKLLPKSFKSAALLSKKATLHHDRIDVHFEKNFPIRHAVEVRNISFLNPWFVELLRKYEVAIVFADTAGRWPYLEDITSDFIYIRLHGDEELYVSGYDNKTLDFWAKRISFWRRGLEPADRQTITDDQPAQIKRDIFVYFDNDAKTKAPANAKTLMEKLDVNQAA